MLEAWVEVCSVDSVEEERVVDGVKRFTDIHRDCSGSKGRFVLVETGCDPLSDRQESGGGGAILDETVLCLGLGERGSEEGEEEILEAGQRREMGQKEDDRCGGLPGLGMGMILAHFQMEGRSEWVIERKKRQVRKETALGPRCFK